MISYLSINITDAQQQVDQITVPNAVDVTASPSYSISGDGTSSTATNDNDNPNNSAPASPDESNSQSSPAGKLSYSLARYPAFFSLCPQ